MWGAISAASTTGLRIDIPPSLGRNWKSSRHPARWSLLVHEQLPQARLRPG
ncbi:MAG: hypothetical protein AVDCRST_MAG05-3622 [uncultured Rubrobacteraceae bacterium]|uniref:Uncharacterized protein n=1 Tax=uncultured Rubrobacteraceae bacterium TaxID=349277 RepID=A0A6J4TFB2_9ACTN|nr:MAG: hypothetical protein AVDCRST_MAG05-3622 [uncultured Rubrobacteraceae bacterium]